MSENLPDNRYETLDGMLVLHESMMRFFSRGQRKVAPAEGYEDIWEAERVCVERIQAKMKEVRYGGERRPHV